MIPKNNFDKALDNKTTRMILFVILVLVIIVCMSIKANAQPKTAYLVAIHHQFHDMKLYKADSVMLDSIVARVTDKAVKPNILLINSNFLRVETENTTLYIERKEEREDGSLRRRKYKPNIKNYSK